LVSVSSNFSYSIIKKRIQMMSIAKPKNRVWIKSLLIFPIAIVFFMSAASFSSSIVSNISGKEIDILKIKPIQKIEIADIDSITTENSEDSLTMLVKEFKDTIPNENLVAVASPERMNVLYLGVDNPVSIAVSGISMNRVTASIQHGEIAGKNGNYIARVTGLAGPITKLTIFVDSKEVATKEFRVKNLPDPTPKVGGLRGGRVDRDWFVAQTGLRADLENFDFDLDCDILSFEMSTNIDGNLKIAKQEHGNKFTDEQILLIKQATTEKDIYFENIIVKVPDGTIRNLGGLFFTIK
jgi:gliding motility-associated protein GldM